MIFCGLDKTQRTKIYGITFHAILKVFILTTFNENCWHRQTTPWLICRVEDGVSRKTCVQFCSFSRIFNHYYKLKGINQENNWRISELLGGGKVKDATKEKNRRNLKSRTLGKSIYTDVTLPLATHKSARESNKTRKGKRNS